MFCKQQIVIFPLCRPFIDQIVLWQNCFYNTFLLTKPWNWNYIGQSSYSIKVVTRLSFMPLRLTRVEVSLLLSSLHTLKNKIPQFKDKNFTLRHPIKARKHSHKLKWSYGKKKRSFFTQSSQKTHQALMSLFKPPTISLRSAEGTLHWKLPKLCIYSKNLELRSQGKSDKFQICTSEVR